MSQNNVPMGARLFGDTIAGATAGAIVAPIVSAVDRALAENASGKCKLWPSFFNSLREMCVHPWKFAKSPQFNWIWLVYGGTYAAVNWAETISISKGADPAFPKWVASSVVNTTTCIGKDRAFAKLYAASAANLPKKVPLGSYAAWLTRDAISMAFFFTLPPIVGKEIAKHTGSERSGYYTAQIGLPLMLQTVTTPIHLLGYDIYNNPNNNFKQRIQFMGKDYWKNVSIRMLRSAPPWCFGTIGNKELRSYCDGYFAKRYNKE